MKNPAAETVPLQVYCRVKPPEASSEEADSCVNVVSNESITVFPPECLSWNKAKQGTYSFNRVFGHLAPQKTVFDEVARPLVQVSSFKLKEEGV